MSNTKIVLSDPAKVDIRAYKGDSGSFRITMDGVDLTNPDLTWRSDIRVNATDAESVTSFDIIPVVGDSSSIDVVLTVEHSQLLPESSVYDIEMQTLDEVHTLIYGSISAKQDVSRS